MGKAGEVGKQKEQKFYLSADPENTPRGRGPSK